MESYLDVQHLTKSFGEKVLFDDMSFSVSEGQKVGLVARNGTGKSTLLSILHGDEGYDAGQIVYRNDIRVGYLSRRRISILRTPSSTPASITRAIPRRCCGPSRC